MKLFDCSRLPFEKSSVPGPHIIRPGSASDRARRRITDANHSRAKDRELHEIPAVQRKIADGFGLDYLPYRGSVRFEQRRGSLYFDRFTHGAGLQREVDFCDLIQLEWHAIVRHLFESLFAGGNRVAP